MAIFMNNVTNLYMETFSMKQHDMISKNVKNINSTF